MARIVTCPSASRATTSGGTGAAGPSMKAVFTGAPVGWARAAPGRHTSAAIAAKKTARTRCDLVRRVDAGRSADFGHVRRPVAVQRGDRHDIQLQPLDV